MGEGWLLTLEERKALLAATIAAAGKRLKIGVVVTAGSPAETLDLAEHAETVGAHHIVISPPPGHFTGEELIRYLQMVREAVSLPLVVVQTSSGGFGFAEIRRIASEFNVSAIKLGASQGNLQDMVSQFGDRVTITDPVEANWLSNLKAVGMKVLYADPEPYLFQTRENRPIEAYYHSFLSGDVARATTISEGLRPIRHLYDRVIMQPLLSGMAPIGTLKAWCEYLGLDVGPPRSPHSPIDHAARQQLHEALRSIGH